MSDPGLHHIPPSSLENIELFPVECVALIFKAFPFIECVYRAAILLGKKTSTVNNSLYRLLTT